MRLTDLRSLHASPDSQPIDDEAGLAFLGIVLLILAAWKLSPTIRVITKDTLGKVLLLAALAAVAVAIFVGLGS